MIKPGIILIGAGGHASACIDVIEQENRFSIVGLIGIETDLAKKCLPYEVIGTQNNLKSFLEKSQYALITIGHSKGLEYRGKLFVQIASMGYKIPSVISPLSYLSKYSNVGNGTIVMHGAKINAGGNVGDNCIINTGALVEHGSQIGSNCHISTGVIVNGDVRIGSGTLIGSGAIIKEGVTIGSNVRIGMGVTVRKDIEDNTTYVGEVK